MNKIKLGDFIINFDEVLWIKKVGCGARKEVTQAYCNKEDTYDFETGVLIALMKMCGVEKVKKAANETFFEVAENAVNEYEEKIHDLEKEVKRLTNVSEGFYEFNGRLIVEIDQKNHEIISLKALKLTNESLKKENEKLKLDCEKLKEENQRLINTRDLLISKNNELIEENEKLKSDKDKSWKKYQRNIQKKQDRINELEAQIKASEDDKLKNIEYYEKEIKNLNYRLTCKDISLEAKDKKISIYEKRMLALEAENEKLKLDCEKLQHGYIDTDI